jgi:hypothetical protein
MGLSGWSWIVQSFIIDGSYSPQKEFVMARKSAAQSSQAEPGFIRDPDGFINIPVSKATRQQLHALKTSMQASSQAEVIERAIAIISAIDKAARI